MKRKIIIVIVLVLVCISYTLDKKIRSHREANEGIKSDVILQSSGEGEISQSRSSISRERSIHLLTNQNLTFSFFYNSFVQNNTTLQLELEKLKKLPERMAYDLETYPNNLNSAMLLHKLRIDNGTNSDMRESVAIFELAASELLLPEIIDNHINYSSLEKLSKKYPEYAEQIHHAYEIRQYYDKLYLTYLNGDKGAEFIKDANQIGKADFSFLHSIISYYKKSQNVNEELMINTLNYFTGGQFGDKNSQWWLGDFERDPKAEFFNNSEKATWLKK